MGRLKVAQLCKIFASGFDNVLAFHKIPDSPLSVDIQGVPKKMSFLRKIAITTLKLIQNAKVGSV